MHISLKNKDITELRILKTAIILPHFPQAFAEQLLSVRRLGFLVVGCQLSVVGSFTQLDFTEQLPSVLFNQCGCNFAEWFFVDGGYIRYGLPAPLLRAEVRSAAVFIERYKNNADFVYLQCLNMYPNGCTDTGC